MHSNESAEIVTRSVTSVQTVLNQRVAVDAAVVVVAMAVVEDAVVATSSVTTVE